MAFPKIKHVRAFVVRGGGADYHDQGEGHWIDDRIATQGWVAADHFSIADIAFGVHVHRWFSLDMPGKRELPNLRAWYDRLLARPPYAAHCAGPLA